MLNDVAEQHGHLGIAAFVKPRADAFVVQKARGNLAVLVEQWHKFLDIAGREIALSIEDEGLVAQDGVALVDGHLFPAIPPFDLVISPPALGVDACQTAYEQTHAWWQVGHLGQSAFLLQTHHVTLVTSEWRMAEPEVKQCDAQAVVVAFVVDLYLAIDDIVIHLGCGKSRGTGLRRPDVVILAFEVAADAEVAKDNLLVVLVAEEEVGRLDVLVDDAYVVTAGQSRCGL